jgi:hypothetical protein
LRNTAASPSFFKTVPISGLGNRKQGGDTNWGAIKPSSSKEKGNARPLRNVLELANEVHVTQKVEDLVFGLESFETVNDFRFVCELQELGELRVGLPGRQILHPEGVVTEAGARVGEGDKGRSGTVEKRC